jgi:hypothetical protein
LLDPLGSAQLIGDQHHVQALSHLGLPRSPCRRNAESCEGRGASGAPGPSPSRHRADPGSRESQCCLTIETSGQLWPVSPNGSASSAMVCSAASSRLRRPRRAGYSNRGHADAVVSLKSRGCLRQLFHPPTHAHQSTPAKHYTMIIAVGFCRGSLARGTERQRITPDQRADNCEPIIP